MNRYICIHGHFYQPPRENPWLCAIEEQDSAYPYHDWNQKISAECYDPNTSSRILDRDRKIIDIINNYTKISFDFGPTLLCWMQRHTPEVYANILKADKESQAKFSGHGAAIAQAYNHIIMPLSSSRDKRTQVLWGIKDFEYRFGRYPEGMWLPETAVDIESLELLAEYGIKFTLLGPHQAKQVREIGKEKWEDVSGEKIDPRMPYLCRLPSGRVLSIFFYEGPLSRAVAFEHLLESGENFAHKLIKGFSDKKADQLMHIATDGETYGHHHRFGDMALAYGLYHIESGALAEITIYGEYLEKHPPTHEVEIIENSSWSCVHGIERWRRDCGCKSGLRPQWNQEWRTPLREAMDSLRDALIPVYEREISQYLKDGWQARDDYIQVILNRTTENTENFIVQHAQRELTSAEKSTVLKLLEMQYCSLLMYTSCGWFFDDISGIESVQILKYAARAMQIAQEIAGPDLEPEYLKILDRAKSNISEFGSAVKIYNSQVKTAIIDLLRVGVHYAISSLFEEYPKAFKLYCYEGESEFYDVFEAGKNRVAIGKANIKSNITWEEELISFAVLHLGDHNLIGGIRIFNDEEAFTSMSDEIKEAFYKGSISEIIHLIDAHFGAHNYSLWHLFKDEKKKILNRVLHSTLFEIELSYRQIYEHHYPIVRIMKEMGIPLPKTLANAVEFVINGTLIKLLENHEFDIQRLQKITEEIKRYSFEVDKTTLNFVASQKINRLMAELANNPADLNAFKTIEAVLKIVKDLYLDLDLSKAQNIYFSIGKQCYNNGMRAKAKTGDETAQKWEEHFNRLGQYLHVRFR